MAVGVVDAGLGLVDDFPAGIKNPLGNAEVFEHGQIFGKAHALPNASAYGGVGVGEMVEAVSQIVGQRRILHQAFLAVDGFKQVLAFGGATGLRHLPAIDSTDGRVFKICQHGLQPGWRLGNRVLRNENDDLTRGQGCGEVSGAGVMELLRGNVLDANRKLLRNGHRLVVRTGVDYNYYLAPSTGLRKHGLQQGANILASIFSEHENRCRNHQAIAILSKVWGRRGTRPVVSSFLVALPRVQAATNLIVKSTVLSPHRRREEASELTETGSMANGSGWAAAGFHNDSNFFHLAASGARFIRPNNCASVIALCC